MKEKVRIGNAGGFWGDDLTALRRQLEGGPLDYISSDYLAEITMSILRKQQLKDERLGYVTDFVHQVLDVAPLIKEKGVTVIANAGGMNPLGCAREIVEGLKGTGNELKIAIVEGDNIYPELDQLYPEKADFKDMEDGQPFEKIKDSVQSANAYLGVGPIIKALEAKADVIIAGRVTDTSISIAPMIYEFGWELNDWDKLASGLIAGHMMECGAQSTGGNYTDWQKVPKWTNFGYPVTEVYPDSSFIMTKHSGTGGLVTADTVREQLVYEMGDPKNYISPDVIADFSTIQIEDLGKDRVRVFGVKGRPSTPFLKVSMAFEDGYKAKGSVIISGGNALEKARVFDRIFWDRLGLPYEKKNTEYVGFDSTHHHLSEESDPSEVLLQFSVYDKEKEKIKKFSENIAPVILSGPPGVAVTGGRPRPHGVMTYWPTLVPKHEVNAVVKLLDKNGEIVEKHDIPSLTGHEEETSVIDSEKQVCTDAGNYQAPGLKNTRRVKFSDICLARSGDKGDMVNIGVVARTSKIYEFLKKYVTADYIKNIFDGMCKGPVTRFELDNLEALNFLLDHSLDGGGTKSLMIDAQGKTFAPALLNQEIDVPEEYLEDLSFYR
ncbi:MAG: DUF1446 domain-containing protein [Bacteroidales bacterium]|nr:DUF1446 domain-containing protein [Bacteroidales bacterium]MCF8339156.1 DUF1446 domain-containing protein [Bacteroidales bacterium]